MKTTNKKIFIIAGEVSGDVLGAKIMQEMPNIDFVGIGGQHMESCGLKSIFPMSDLSVLGIFEVIAHAKVLKTRIKQTIYTIIQEKPDMVLTIDSPGFAKAVVSAVKKSDKLKHTKFYHFVAPQVWAWRPGRAKKYAETFDKLYAFFDFEIPYFTKYGLDTVAVGHPVADNIMGKYRTKKTTGDKIVALMPGSRIMEAKKLLPLFRQFVESAPAGYKFVIPTVETTDKFVRSAVENWRVQPEIISSNARYDLYTKTFVAIAASGTVSVELAMMHIPAIIVYRMNWLTSFIGRILVHVKWVSLVNILLNKSVYPEFLGADATSKNILREFNNIANNANMRQKMIANLRRADVLWRPDSASVGERIAAGLFE